MIEQDEQIIKKLMNMLGNGRQLKLKSKNGQTIRISFQGSSYNDTEPQSSKQHSQEHIDHEQDRNQEQVFMPQPEEQYEQEQQIQYFGDIQEDLKEMEDDFSALTKTKERINDSPSPDQQDLQPFHLPNIEQINQINSESSKKQDSLFKEFGLQQQVKEKPKRILLSSKNVKKDNESVISFFREQHNNLGVQFQNDFAQIQSPITLSSSPVITRIKQEAIDLVNYKSKTVKQSMNKLKELHPQSEQIVQMISSRIDELQSIEKSISYINSSISNSLSLGFQSFDISMLSFNRSISDPLCHLMANFIHKARYQSNKHLEKSIPSSFLFMYSQPLVDIEKKQIGEQIDYFQQEQIVQKILKEGKCKVDYIHVPATVQKFHYWIAKGVEIVHFCGHGVQSRQNYLLFQNDQGESQNVTVSRLTELLSDKKNSLKLVFVASCHSESAGKVFFEAGANHVICIRDEYQILDEACHQFVKIFYLTCINTRITICEAFELSKKQLMLKGKFSKHQCQKFIIIRNHTKNHCTQQFEHRNQILNFNDLNPRPEFNKYMLSRVEHYIPRSKEIYEIIQLIQKKKRRYISIIGQSGLGKSTLVRQLVRYIQFRNFFRDGTVYLQLARCETMAKVFQVLDLQFFQTSQLKLNKTPVQNALRLSKQLGDKSILLVFDNCQAIMASEDKENFKKLTEIIMKNCINVVFIFTNRYSISRQIDFCSQVLFQLGKLTVSQSKTLFFKKVPREISKKQYNEFFKLDVNENLTQISQHSFFQFLNGHPQAICLTASLLAQRTLSQLHRLLLEPNISNQLNKGIQKQSSYRQGINKVVSTAMKISLNVVHHKYKDASQMIKILSLLPNGLQSQMMNKIFPNGKWKDIIKRLINHSLIQCIQKASCRYYLVHPQIITQVENEIGMQEKIRYHERICSELIHRINKIYKFVGTSSQYSQRAHQLFLVQEDNYRAIFLRELNIIGEKYPLRKFYENLFKFEFQGLDDEQKNDFGEKKISNAQIIAMVELNKKKKSLQLQKNMQKKQPIDLLIVYYLTIVFIIKKVKTSAIETYLNYGFTISLRRNKYLVIANLLRLKACIYISQGNDNDAKQFFQIAHAEFAQLGCGLGSACCQAALGYIKLSQSQYAPAKKNLQNALKYYQQIPHPFGKHYLNRWLCSLKSKMNKQQKQLINHKLEAQKLLKQTKQNLRSNNLNNTSYVKHKFGYFAFRFLFDNISLFLEATFEVDLRPKFINQPLNKKHNIAEKNNVILQDIYNEDYGNEQSGQVSIKSQIKYQTKPQIKHDFSQFKLGATSFQNNLTKQNKEKKESQQSSRNSSKQDNVKMISNNLKQKSITSIKYKKSVQKELAVPTKPK